MKRIMVLAIIGFRAIVLTRAALDTALAVPRIAADAKERAAW